MAPEIMFPTLLPIPENGLKDMLSDRRSQEDTADVDGLYLCMARRGTLVSEW